jgi:hypothetical protein
MSSLDAQFSKHGDLCSYIFTGYPNLVLVVTVASAVGSLIPSADSPHAAVFHSEVRGIGGGYSNLLYAPGAMYPVFGLVTNYLIYGSAVIFYDSPVLAVVVVNHIEELTWQLEKQITLVGQREYSVYTVIISINLIVTE